MIFKDREDAGEQLAEILKMRMKSVPASKVIVASLLRGGVIVGSAVAHKIGCGHIALPVAKIRAPHNPELALGAVCFDITYLEKNVIELVSGLKKIDITEQIKIAKKRFEYYREKFFIDEIKTHALIAGQNIIIVDDGIATGATAKAATLYASIYKPQSIIIASPVVINNFQAPGIELITINLTRNAQSISQFYRFFPQIGDDEVKKFLRQPTK